MSHKVRVNAGQVKIALPDKNVYDGQVDVTLTDEQYAKIRPALFPTVLTDLGALPDPAVDSSFATDAELAAGLATKVDVVADPGAEIAASVLSANYVLTTAFVTIPSWQVVVPANSGTIEVGVPEGLLVNIVTGTNPAGTAFTVSLRIEDEANALVGFTQWQIFSSSALSQGWAQVVPLMKSVSNNGAAKTYHVAAKMDKVGTLSATSTIFTAASGFTNPTLRAVRR